VRDGAFDIGMFRSYWERAAKLTGDRIADLTVRPIPSGPGPLTPATAVGAVNESSAEPADDNPDGDNATRLAGLIVRALESADQLAKSTRRTRTKDKSLLEAGGTSDPARG
jgi:hypothetical protein